MLIPFVTGVFIASFGWQCLLAAIGTILGVRLPGNGRRFTGVLGGLIIAILAVRVVVGA